MCNNFAKQVLNSPNIFQNTVVLFSMVDNDMTKLITNPQYKQVKDYSFGSKLISLLCLALGDSRFPPFRFDAFPLVEHNSGRYTSPFPLLPLVSLLKCVKRVCTSPSGIIPRFLIRCHGLGFTLSNIA